MAPESRISGLGVPLLPWPALLAYVGSVGVSSFFEFAGLTVVPMSGAGERSKDHCRASL